MLDANGIWVYDESESVAPFSATLNRLANSTSDVVAPWVPHATGTVSLSGGLGSGGADIWRRGEIVGIEISVQLNSATTNTSIGTVATQFRPPFRVTVPLSPNSAGPTSVFVQVNTDGDLMLYMYGSGGGAATYIRGGATWPAAT